MYWPLISSIRAYLWAALRRGCPAIFLGLHAAPGAWRSPCVNDGSLPPAPRRCAAVCGRFQDHQALAPCAPSGRAAAGESLAPLLPWPRSGRSRAIARAPPPCTPSCSSFSHELVLCLLRFMPERSNQSVTFRTKLRTIRRFLPASVMLGLRLCSGLCAVTKVTKGRDFAAEPRQFLRDRV